MPAEFPGLNYLDDLEVHAVMNVLAEKHLYRYYGGETQGEVARFEAEFAASVGVSHAVAVTSGTGALHTALAALWVGPGQEVIIPAYLWVSVVAAVVNRGAIPILADIDETFCLDPASVERNITSRTSAIIAVHMSGGQVDVSRLLEIARRHGLFLLEDCAQCVGGSIAGRPVGSFGDIATFSFQINKNMTSGEAGCIVTNDDRLHRRAAACHDAGFIRSRSEQSAAGTEEPGVWGGGYRLDELRAAILRVQLRKLPRVVEHMRRSKYRILQALRQYPEIQLRRIVDPAGDTGGFLISTYRDAHTARAVHRILIDNGISTASPETSNCVLADYGLHIYSNIKPLLHKASTDKSGTPWNLVENRDSKASYEKGRCPVADDLFDRSIILTIPSCLTVQDENDIVAGFDRAMEELRA